jgi:hypothetical protein
MILGRGAIGLVSEIGREMIVGLRSPGQHLLAWSGRLLRSDPLRALRDFFTMLFQCPHGGGGAFKEADDGSPDEGANVLGRFHIVNPAANCEVEEIAVKAPGNFQFAGRERAVTMLLQSGETSQVETQRLDNFLLNQIEVTLRNADAPEAGENEDANPIVSIDHREIGFIESDQTALKRLCSVVQDDLPFRLPPAEIDLLVDSFDQSFLGGKITKDILVRDAKTLREIAKAAVETDFGKKGDCTIDNFTFPIFRLQPASALFGSRVFLRSSPAVGSLHRSMCSFGHRIHTMHSSYKIRITLLITTWQLNSLNCVD